MLDLALPLILGLTTMTALVGLLGDDRDTPDNDEDREIDQPTDGRPPDEKYVDLGPDRRGSFVGSEHSEKVTVWAETSFQTTHLFDKYEEEMASPLDVRGGGGDDVLILEGRGYVVHGDEGADRIELRGASNVAVFAGSDDTVLGGSGEGNYVQLNENAYFLGGAGTDQVLSSSTAAASMGGGNDTFIGVHSPSGAGEVASLVYGGDGDDHLVGSMRRENLWWEHATDRGYISFDSDTLLGGAGNDTIIGSHSDSIVGGPDNDHFILVLSDDPRAEGAAIADFSKGEDRIDVRYECSQGSKGASSEHRAISYEDFQTNLDPSKGFTILNSIGKVIVQFPGVNSLVVGFRASEDGPTTGTVVDLEGNPISLEDCDVVIQGFHGTSF